MIIVISIHCTFAEFCVYAQKDFLYMYLIHRQLSCNCAGETEGFIHYYEGDSDHRNPVTKKRSGHSCTDSGNIKELYPEYGITKTN